MDIHYEKINDLIGVFLAKNGFFFLSLHSIFIYIKEREGMHLKIRLTILSFLEFAVWGAYLTSMGTFLASIGMASRIGWFYSVQGFVSLFMPALMGMVADRWIPAQRLLTLCHFVAGSFMLAVATYSHYSADQIAFSSLFPLYACSVVFFMPTIALTNSVACCLLPGV